MRAIILLLALWLTFALVPWLMLAESAMSACQSTHTIATCVTALR